MTGDLRRYGGDPALALRIVLSTLVVSLVTTPLWIRFGLKFVGVGEGIGGAAS